MAIADWIEIGRMDELGRMDTSMHRLDARAKAVVTLVFIVVVMSFSRYEVSALTPFLLYPLVLMMAGRIPMRDILGKLLVALPFALVIGLFNPLMDRQPMSTVGLFVVTGGWLSLVSILFRFVLTVGAALGLVACTGMYRLGAGLEQLGVPRVFVVQLLFLHRYLFVVADEGATMLRGVALRSAGVRTLRFQVYGSLLGHLLLRSMERADRVYRAMVARGFDGEIRRLEATTFKGTDWGFLFGWTAFFVVARVWNLADLAGRFIVGSMP